MAKLLEDQITIKFSKLVKESDTAESALSSEVLANIELVVQELVGESVIVDVEVR
jgi:hypothetical protein